MIDQPQGEIPQGDKPQEEKPALTVVIQSWWTLPMALIMLVVGLTAGYLGRPLLNKGSTSEGDVATVVTQDVAAPTAQGANPTPDPTQVQQMMDSIISQTKNFQGDPNATVTIIEFSDYQ